MEHLSKNIDNKTAKSFYNAPTAKSGIFTTFAHNSKESDFRKSCIQHLPGSYYKVDLAGKLDFVVVFQAIEIQRLSVEVQNLRVLLKDSERQVATYLSYEVQIKELTESYHQLEEQLKNYQCELQKMSLACNALYQENSQNKRAFQKEQNESSNIINDLQNENSQLKSSIREIESKLREAVEGDQQKERKNKLISQELVRLNENLLLGQNELGELRESYVQKNRQLEKCSQEMKRWEQCAREQNEQLKNELLTYKNRAEQLDRLVDQLKNRIQQGTQAIQQVKQALLTYDSEINSGKVRQQQLLNQLAKMEVVLKQNGQLNDQIAQLNAQLGQREDEIFSKEQQINDLTLQNKELLHNGQSLQINVQNITQNMKQLQSTLDKQRQTFSSQKGKLEKELAKVRQQGLISESTKKQLAALKHTCQQQAQEIQNVKVVLQTVPKLLQKLKEKNRQHQQVEKTNENLRKQLSNSIQMNEQLFEKMGAQLSQISGLMDEIYSLEEQLRNEKDKNDDFMSCSTEKTIVSTVASREPLWQIKNQTPSPSYNFASSYNHKERNSSSKLPQFNYGFNKDRTLNEKSYSTYETNSNVGGHNKKYSIIGKLDFTSTANNLAKSMMANEGGLFQSRKVLEPSSCFPSREGNLSYRQSASSAYEQFKRQRRF